MKKTKIEELKEKENQELIDVFIKFQENFNKVLMKYIKKQRKLKEIEK